MYTRHYQLGDGEAAAAPPAAPPRTTFNDVVHSPSVKTGAAIALTFHGYRRTGSLFWALVYGLAGRTIPVVAVPISLAQGFGAKKPCP